ncbi:MAG: hypothetical protein HWE34_09240 [Methylocystaceae bacterium]|nr:hypothetical protein [Methylocystaceae bacterium]
MSIEAAREFRSFVKGSAKLEQAVGKLLDEYGLLNIQETIKLGAQYGYTFNETDIEAIFANDNEELTDFEQEMISAGLPINSSSGATEMS